MTTQNFTIHALASILLTGILTCHASAQETPQPAPIAAEKDILIGVGISGKTPTLGKKWPSATIFDFSGTCMSGPELTFGIYMHKALGEPFLLIKNAWGAKSLKVDFHPPSGRLPEDEKSRAAAGYELAGFLWFQGFNNIVGDYPLKIPKDKKSGKNYSEYSRLIACLIRDVRMELAAPDMPFVVGVLGVGGPKKEPDAFRQSIAAPAAMPEFKGNVFNVFTEKYFPVELSHIEKKINEFSTRSNQGFHHYGSARFFTLPGKAFAEALEERGDS
jgi:hypothetical protein